MTAQFELDHIFIMTTAKAPEADSLVELGLKEGAQNSHYGQGTACRRFFFNNAVLELLWIEDEAEALLPQTAPTKLWERAHPAQTGYSPFGVCLRPSPANTDPNEPPFPAWIYKPDYLPGELSIFIAENADHPEEPMLFYLPFATNTKTAPHDPQHLNNTAVSTISKIEIAYVAQPTHSAAIETLSSNSELVFISATEPKMSITFDNAKAGKNIDLSAILPLELKL